MIKHTGYALAALLCFASQGFARQPLAYDPIAETQSVLVRADDAPMTADVGTPTPMPEVASSATSEDETNIVSAPPMLSQPTTTYRSARPTRNSNGVAGNLIELERRKNAWLRRTFLGR